MKRKNSYLTILETTSVDWYVWNYNSETKMFSIIHIFKRRGGIQYWRVSNGSKWNQTQCILFLVLAKFDLSSLIKAGNNIFNSKMVNVYYHLLIRVKESRNILFFSLARKKPAFIVFTFIRCHVWHVSLMNMSKYLFFFSHHPLSRVYFFVFALRFRLLIPDVILINA